MMAITGARTSDIRRALGSISRIAIPTVTVSLTLAGRAYGAFPFVSLQIVTVLNNIGALLGHIAPLLSAALFILAGIFYAIGQIMPPDKKAAFHTTSVNIIIGAVVLSALSLAATGLANVSTQLLTNQTVNGTLVSNT